MKNILKSMKLVGNFIGLLVGSNFTTPAIQVLEQYPNMSVF